MSTPPSVFHAASKASRLRVLLGLPPAELGGGLVVEPDAAPAPVLERVSDEDPANTADDARPDEHLALDVDRTVLDVVPGESEQLAPSESGDEREPPDRVEPIAGGYLEERADLLPRPCGPFYRVVTRGRIHGQGGVHEDVATPDGITQGLAERDVNVADALTPERPAAASASFAERPVELVQVPSREPLERDLPDPRCDPRLDHSALRSAVALRGPDHRLRPPVSLRFA
jgi:hypothetical protein